MERDRLVTYAIAADAGFDLGEMECELSAAVARLRVAWWALPDADGNRGGKSILGEALELLDCLASVLRDQISSGFRFVPILPSVLQAILRDFDDTPEGWQAEAATAVVNVAAMNRARQGLDWAAVQRAFKTMSALKAEDATLAGVKRWDDARGLSYQEGEELEELLNLYPQDDGRRLLGILREDQTSQPAAQLAERFIQERREAMRPVGDAAAIAV